MKSPKLFYLVTIIFFVSSGCAVMNRNIVYDTYLSAKPKNIALAIQSKSILERPTSGSQFSESSLFPDTLDEGSSMAYKGNSIVADFINSEQIYSVFRSELVLKKFTCQLLPMNQFSKPDTIRNIIQSLRVDLIDKVDAILFVDYSPMFNRYFASKGVRDNNGHSLYLRYALFDLATNQMLIRYEEVLHLDFYFKQPSKEEMAKDIEFLLSKDLQNNFPVRIGN